MKKLLLSLIRFYRRAISPLTPSVCRFTPTCSQYAYEAIHNYGAIKGSWLAIRRLLRCHPFYKGCHYDPVPKLRDVQNQPSPGATKEDNP